MREHSPCYATTLAPTLGAVHLDGLLPLLLAVVVDRGALGAVPPHLGALGLGRIVAGGKAHLEHLRERGSPGGERRAQAWWRDSARRCVALVTLAAPGRSSACPWTGTCTRPCNTCRQTGTSCSPRGPLPRSAACCSTWRGPSWASRTQSPGGTPRTCIWLRRGVEGGRGGHRREAPCVFLGSAKPRAELHSRFAFRHL